MSGSPSIAPNSSFIAEVGSPVADSKSGIGSKFTGASNLAEDNFFLHHVVHHGITISSAVLFSLAYLVPAKCLDRTFSIQKTLIPSFISNLFPLYFSRVLNPDDLTPKVVSLIKPYTLSHTIPPEKKDEL